MRRNSNVRLPTESFLQCGEKPELYKGFAGIVRQPARYNQQIPELESLYQTRLFNRLGNTISLTESGNVLLEHCERILAEYRKLEYDMHLLHNEYNGQLRLGASTTIAQYVLPPILAAFTDKYPKVSVSLIDTNSLNVEQALQEHNIRSRYW